MILKILSVDTLIKTLNFSCDLDPKLSHLTFSLDTPWLLKSVNMVLNIHRNHKAYYNIRDREKWWRGYGGGRGRLYTYYHTVTTRMTSVGSNDSHFNVSLIVTDKVTRQCPQTTTFEEKGELTEVLLLTSLTNTLLLGQTGYRWSTIKLSLVAKESHHSEDTVKVIF